VLVENRDDFRRFLADRGIGTDVHYPILDCDQPAWPDLSVGCELENSRWAASRIVSLPLFIGMTGEELNAVCDATAAYYAS
jgi:dTDP-3-amino-2,3,6-trideoxy-4-keto-D-glucose/dTDP-3-amino-3,4,6-trideoxy-alpha-D-glucose/dTDP-2,6-dideoxy-D-kanosamine transaminase